MVAAPIDRGRLARVLRAGPPSAVRVVWQDFPEELRQICEPYLMRELPVLPRWVTELRIKFDPTDDSGMWSQIQPEYRNGYVTFCGQWFGGTEQYRRSTIRHEFVHFALEHLSAFVRRVVNAMEGDAQLRDHLLGELRRTLECSTCDVEEMLGAALEMERE
jgi:hypothetical protein